MIILVLLVGIGFSALAHWRMQNFVHAIILSSVSGALLLMAIDIVMEGRFDWFWSIGLVLLIAIYTVISFMVGFGMREWFAAHPEDDDDDEDD